MSNNRNYDTVAFDIRENATMLFFARTTSTGDIDDYLLLMRATGKDYEESTYLEINERQLAGHDLIREARLTGNVLTLALHEPAAALDGANEIVLTYDETSENRASVEKGAFLVLGDTLCCGNA
ncbi:MAG: hypothetical protein WD795_02200 [Woeseia sp.]